MHDFQESLAKSHAADEFPFWRDCYQKFFPTMQAMINHRQDGDHQRAGIDRSVVLGNSKQILIDEKCRFRNKRTGKVYSDIALEFLSNDRTGALGWACKPLLCDYIAYAIAPLGQCYLLPVTQLQRAYAVKGPDWKKQYPISEAKNPGYKTLSVCVPVAVVMRAINKSMYASFSPPEEQA